MCRSGLLGSRLPHSVRQPAAEGTVTRRFMRPVQDGPTTRDGAGRRGTTRDDALLVPVAIGRVDVRTTAVKPVTDRPVARLEGDPWPGDLIGAERPDLKRLRIQAPAVAAGAPGVPVNGPLYKIDLSWSFH